MVYIVKPEANPEGVASGRMEAPGNRRRASRSSRVEREDRSAEGAERG